MLNKEKEEKEKDEVITVFNTDYRFLLGDLNFRMDLTYEEALMYLENYQ